ncbi:hypothetical protein [Hyphomonas sp.]|uniref:hypothetical protein n=1 Tax=Hyphomonas sp. TaxID=87 RepID=UPI0025BB56DC|nr:hypothetical protein [Hyphomonas sp.]
MDALLSGDLHAARHLSYYAQLRGALSILAFSGIGIFNGLCFAIDANGRRSNLYSGRRSPGTHVAAWQALEAWGDEPAQAARFMNAIQFGGASLFDSVQAIWPSSTAISLVSQIVDAWGVDLKSGVRDHDARNISSYNPHQLNPHTCSAVDAAEFVQHVWSVLEPVSGGDYVLLDRHLLRRLLQQVHQTVEPPGTPFSAGAIFARHANLAPRVAGLASRDFLSSVVEPDDLPLLAKAQVYSSGNAIGMISRAVLLLRVATGITRSALKDAGFLLENDALGWLEATGVDRGFWPSGSASRPQFAELWDDVALALDDLGRIIVQVPPDRHSMSALLGMSSRYLGQCERAFMWGLGT